MTKELTSASLAFAMILPAAAFASDFSSMDTNGDGYVTMSEFQEAMPDAPADAFMAADADADGALSEDELAAAKDAGTFSSNEG
ncbi:EF-hand domain-containing protein [uncultured Roseovarius sp.]|uniref:EF-hand domain-containing protein n=1 Tax=uncultured Roseovarius sp. TaxID=293344 RepID=UPI0026100FBE|nr:EF-hand domain-containing protein [uncultured Roseovarius sp.]